MKNTRHLLLTAFAFATLIGSIQAAPSKMEKRANALFESADKDKDGALAMLEVFQSLGEGKVYRNFKEKKGFTDAEADAAILANPPGWLKKQFTASDANTDGQLNESEWLAYFTEMRRKSEAKK